MPLMRIMIPIKVAVSFFIVTIFRFFYMNMILLMALSVFVNKFYKKKTGKSFVINVHKKINNL